MKLLAALFVILIISGCESVGQIRLNKDASWQKLNPSGSAYILFTEDAMYGSKQCTGSGSAITQLISSDFQKHLNTVKVSNIIGEKQEEGLKKAKAEGFTYLVDSKILLWENRPTEWSGMWDRIELKMNIVDVNSENLIDSVIIKGHGTWVTFGGYHPQNIVDKEINKYVASLFP